MRTRTRTKSRYADCVEVVNARVGWPSPCSEIYQFTNDLGPKEVYREVETMVDEEPVGVSHGKPERSCWHSKTELAIGEGKAVQVLWGQNRWVETPMSSFTGLPSSVAIPGPPTWELPDLLADLLEELDPRTEVMQGMPFIGELASTIKMVRSPLSFLQKLRVPRGMRQLPLGRVLSKLGLDRASNAWLQYQYGWAPLMGDLGRTAEGCATMYEQYQQYLKGSGCHRRARKGGLGPGFYEESWNSPDDLVVNSCSQSAKVTIGYELLPAADIGPIVSYPVFLAQKFGITPSNLASTAWELVPYSFVVDWFLPVGQLLSKKKDVQAHFSIRKKSYHHTIDCKIEKLISLPPTTPMCGHEPSPRRGSPVTAYSARKKDYFRNYLGHEPGWHLSASGFTNKRVISALSLIAQRLITPIKG